MSNPLFRYIALGDSSGVGVGSNDDGGYPERLFRRMKARGLNVGILNLAQSGATTRDLIRGQLERAVSRQPSLVTIGIGTNDVWRLVPADVFGRNVAAIADRLATTGAQIVVCNLIDLAHAPAAAMAEAWAGIRREQITQRVREFNRHLDALASQPRFHVVDLFSFSQREAPGHPEYFCPDGFHPSRLGYDRWAEVCWPTLEATLPAEKTADEAARV